MDSKLEPMDQFFERRAESYDDHMMQNVEGADQYYQLAAGYLPLNPGIHILDLGCGTGLELEEIWKRNPTACITGIDLCAAMLEKLKMKYPGQRDRLELIQGDYFRVEFGRERFRAVVSIQTLHHFTHREKKNLYQKIYDCLEPGGLYVEADYTAQNQEEEDFYFQEIERLRAEQGITEGLFHYDTPCTVENQAALMEQAGFARVMCQQRIANTGLFTAWK